jgi:hypothetical protein
VGWGRPAFRGGPIFTVFGGIPAIASGGARPSGREQRRQARLAVDPDERVPRCLPAEGTEPPADEGLVDLRYGGIREAVDARALREVTPQLAVEVLDAALLVAGAGVRVVDAEPPLARRRRELEGREVGEAGVVVGQDERHDPPEVRAEGRLEPADEGGDRRGVALRQLPDEGEGELGDGEGDDRAPVAHDGPEEVHLPAVEGRVLAPEGQIVEAMPALLELGRAAVVVLLPLPLPVSHRPGQVDRLRLEDAGADPAIRRRGRGHPRELGDLVDALPLGDAGLYRLVRRLELGLAHADPAPGAPELRRRRLVRRGRLVGPFGEGAGLAVFLGAVVADERPPRAFRAPAELRGERGPVPFDLLGDRRGVDAEDRRDLPGPRAVGHHVAYRLPVV